MSLPPPATLTLIFGAIGAGKSHLSARIAERDRALVLATDKWFERLYLDDMPNPPELSWVLDRIKRCEEQIWAVALQAIALAIPVILDIGLATRSARAAYHDRCIDAALDHQFVFVHAPFQVRIERVVMRNAARDATGDLYVSNDVFRATDAMFEEPSSEELARLRAAVFSGRLG